MSLFVLDASVALAWFVDNPVDAYAVRVQARLQAGDRAIVPGLWESEFANGILMAERRRLMTALQGDACMAEMDRLRLTSIEADSEPRNMREVLVLARSFHLTVYDARYLELAKRAGLRLATLDKSLRVAADKAGVAEIS